MCTTSNYREAFNLKNLFMCAQRMIAIFSLYD